MPPISTSAKKQGAPLQRVAVRNAITGKTTMSAVPAGSGGRGLGKKTSGSGGSGKLPASPSPTSVCDECKDLFHASTAVVAAYTGMFARTKRLVLDDAVHHHYVAGDEPWLRVLRALGADPSAPRNGKTVAESEGSAPSR